ncbi:MAG: hypothetical protein HZA28_03215 [Candidatus Omnitrophica bacterium]|nr:hypothetical protein [Candidatus Omnitrophota bacterium]
MMNRAKRLLVIPLLALSLSGCVYLIVGGVGALGGYIVSPDTVEGLTEADLRQVWDTAVDVISIMGLVDSKNESGGVIQASVNGAKVTVVMTQMSSSSVKLSVKARKHYLPKISLSQDVFVKIMSRVNE